VRHFNNEIIHREKIWSSGVNGASVNGGVSVHINDDEGVGEEYWRNRAYQAEHTAAAVCLSIIVHTFENLRLSMNTKEAVSACLHYLLAPHEGGIHRLRRG
jgi:hypothetical protein